MAVANSSEIDGRIAILYHLMTDLTVYLLKVANLRTVGRHLRYPGNCLGASLLFAGQRFHGSNRG